MFTGPSIPKQHNTTNSMDGLQAEQQQGSFQNEKSWWEQVRNIVTLKLNVVEDLYVCFLSTVLGDPEQAFICIKKETNWSGARNVFCY